MKLSANIPEAFCRKKLTRTEDFYSTCMAGFVGASAGWEITLGVSAKIAEDDIKYVMMGGCWPGTYKDFLGYDLHGSILSIYEKTDPHQSCIRIFENKRSVKVSKEVMINTGLSHGFIYKGFKEWVDPVVSWSMK